MYDSENHSHIRLRDSVLNYLATGSSIGKSAVPSDGVINKTCTQHDFQISFYRE